MEMTILKAYASLQLVPAMLAHRWWLVALVLVASALFGRRVYCRFLCPLGLAQSLVRAFRGRRRICSRLDGVSAANLRQRTVRLVILAVCVAVGFAGLGWQWLEPYAIVCRAACCFSLPELDLAWVLFALGPAVVVLLLALVAGGRLWCNWVCPLGTILSLVGFHPWKGDKVKKCAGCETCGRCFK